MKEDIFSDKIRSILQNLGWRVTVICFCFLLALIGPWGIGLTWADTMSSEQPQILHAPDIPSQLERGFSRPVTQEEDSVLPEAVPEVVKEVPRFISDSKLTLHLRNYYLTRNDLEGRKIETWAQGGWLRLTSGRAWDILTFGATVYGSYKLDGPDDRDGASLLKPGQESFTVLGELYAKLNYAGYVLKLGRQEYDLPFLNRQDSRMVPNTFEAYSLSYLGEEDTRFQFGAGYMHQMKKRNADSFIPMSEAAGGPPGVKRGAFAGGARYKVTEDFALEAFDIYTPDILNIFYSEAVYRTEIKKDVGIRLAAQFIYQESVGDELLELSSSSTNALGVKADISYRRAVLTMALTANSSSENLISPYGSYGGYNSVIINDYRRAGESGIRTGLSYDFAQLGLKGLSGFGNYVWGSGAEDPETHADIPDKDELDLTLDYRFQEDSFLKGLSVRLRAAFVEEEGGDSAEDYRVIINYEL